MHENYVKQTYRNRMEVLTDKGVLKLSIPVRKGNEEAASIRDMQINLQDRWHVIHQRTLDTAYNSSPFYEFYKDDLDKLWRTPSESLMAFNIRCHNTISDIMEWDLPLNISEQYVESNENDLRPIFNKAGNIFIAQEYHQVFMEKCGFASNLSILDLIFNLGPEAGIYLRNLSLNDYIQ